MALPDGERGGLLVLEDDRGTCALEAQRLEALGLEVIKAYGTEDVRAALAAGRPPELMLVDYTLPGTNALEFIRQLKAGGTEVPPFIVVTGRGDEAVAVASMKAGACDYLVKNSELLDNLVPAVRKALEKVRLERRLEAAQRSTARNLRLYSFLAQVNLAASQTRERGGLFRQICEIAVTTGGLRMAWIGLPDRDLGRLVPLCSAGAVDGYLDGLHIPLSGDGPLGKGPSGRAASSLKIYSCAAVASAPEMAPWREKALARGYLSSAAIPLMQSGRLAAVLSLYSSQAGFFSGEELKLLEEIRGDISLALDAISAEENRAAAQAQLDRTAADLAHIMDITPVMLFKLRLSGSEATSLEWVSGNVAAFTGYSPEEALRPGWVKANIHPEDIAGSAGIEEILARKTLVHDFRFRRKSGDYVWVHAQLKLSNEESREITGSWTDITPLKESEERFQELFQKAPLGYQSLDAEGRFLEVNQAWLDALGYERGEVIGRWFGDFLAPEYVAAFKVRFPMFKAAGRVHSEFELLRKDGGRLFMAFDGRIARDRDGGFQRTHCILRDITEARQAESRLKLSEAKFRTLFECGNDAMFLHPLGPGGEPGKFTEVNGVACERLGYTREELLAMGPADLDADGMDEVRAGAVRRLAAEGSALFEMNHRAKDGRVLRAEISARRFDYDGAPYVISVARDISDRKRAEAEKALLSETIKASLNEIYLFDAQTFKFRLLNKGALQNTGYTEEEAARLTPLDLKPEMTRTYFEGLIAPLRAGQKQVQVFETTHRRKDGSEYPVEVHLQYEPSNDVFLAVISDITERRKAEAALRDSEGRLSRILENSPDLLYRYRLGPDPGFEYVSPSCLKITGYTQEEHYADPQLGFKMVHPEDRALLARAAAGTGGLLELRWVRKDGQVIWTEQKNVVISDEAGRPAAIEGIARDISARRETEAALRESEETFRRLVEYSPDGVFIQLDDRFEYLNPEALRLFGASRATELIGRPVLSVFREDFRGAVSERLQKLAREGDRLQETEEVCLRLDGSEVPVMVSAVPFDKGDRKGSIVTLRDLTQKKQMEQDLLLAQKIESLGVLAGGIAHDFNNMLTGITANLSLLGARNPGSAELLEDALGAARSAQGLTAQLLSFSRGGQPVKKEISLERGLKEIYSLSTSGASVRQDLDLCERLWSVNADENQLKQAVNNLLLNAVQAMPGGGTLSMKAENLERAGDDGLPLKPGKYLRITVGDTGIGIPDKYLPRLFEPYFTTKPKGHGLGLAMTWTVIKGHGGYITAESVPGKGSTFSVYLPASGRCLQDGPAAAAAQVRKGSGRVLLLEDEDIVVRAAVRMLSELGYECEVTADGAAALERYSAAKAEGTPFDAVIMDLTIPGGMGGKAAGAELRRRHPEAVIIVSSGYSDEPVMADYKAFGFDAVLPKPYRYEDIAEALARLLAKK